MTLTVEAVYKNGLLKPLQALPLKENEKVQITVHSSGGWVKETAGIMGWTGGTEEADYFAMSPELDFPPPPEDV